MSKKYKITLTPVDKFFFGGDMTFQVGNDEKDRFNEQFSSYIIKSTMFPQQTSLLGMLRFLILRNSGDKVFQNGKIVNKKLVEKLIGSKSFSINKKETLYKVLSSFFKCIFSSSCFLVNKMDKHKKNEFGKIVGLSHVRVQRIDRINKTVSELEFVPLYDKEMDWNGANKGWFNFKEISIPNMSYDAKKGLESELTDGTNNYKLTDIFIEDRRIGIHRNITTGKTEEGALFKQISYRFNNEKANHCFVFDAEIANDIDLASYNGQLVSVGGDNSYFIIGITENNTSNNNICSIDNAVYLLSPAFLTREEAQLAKFAITNLIPFRFLETTVKAKSYSILHNDVKRSKVKYELYTPGSIFYFEDDKTKNKFTKNLESKEDFRQIGYNEYK